jgi:hypothetical protein
VVKIRWFDPFVIISFLFIIQFHGIADDGMWMPHQMKMLNLETEGLEMNPGDLYKPDGTGLMSAVVDLGGGTANFVSCASEGFRSRTQLSSTRIPG